MPALFVAAAVASLAYLSIIFSLSVVLQHIGKGICIVLVFAQIPGATGLYPIEMTSGFFQAIYPLFPFTYGIGAMREAICGFYGTQYEAALAVLGLFFLVGMAFGLLVRPLMANVNRMVARQVREGGLFNGENVEVPMRPYRLSQIMRALSDKGSYGAELERRYERFSRWYPRLMRGRWCSAWWCPWPWPWCSRSRRPRRCGCSPGRFCGSWSSSWRSWWWRACATASSGS